VTTLQPSPSRLFLQVSAAHLIGLTVLGLGDTIGATAGFGSGLGSVIFLGGVLSLPWLPVLVIAIWWKSIWIDHHILTFAIIGPILVGASYFMIGGFLAFELTATSAAISSVALLLIRAAMRLFVSSSE
jgi:hypothetical protein